MRNNPPAVSIGIIPSPTPGHIILIERSDGGLALPGGYVDECEDVSTAVNREIFEEIGLELETEKWQLFFSSVTPTNKLLLFSYYPQPVAVPEFFTPNEEVARVFSAPWSMPLRFSLHSEAVRRWRTVAKPWLTVPLVCPVCRVIGNANSAESVMENSQVSGF